MDYEHINRSKFLLLYHIILVTKYRNQVLDKVNICQTLIEISFESDFVIVEQNFEPDHVHMIIKSNPSRSVLSLIRRIKSMSTNRLWKQSPQILKKYFWREKTLWSDSYFVCTLGNVSYETIKNYIQSQG